MDRVREHDGILAPDVALGMRLVPDKMFESYTPKELELKRLTLDSPRWVSEATRRIMQQTKKPLRFEEWELHFRGFINRNFPLSSVDHQAFFTYVLQKEMKAAETFSPHPLTPTEEEAYRIWHSSHPSGQQHLRYPSMNYRDEPPSYSMLR